MLRHAGISEIYTRGHPLLSLAPSTKRARLPVHNLRHVTSCLVSFIFYRLPFPASLYLSRSLASLASLASRRQRDWVIQWFVLLITELREGRGTMAPSSRQERNERRELRISRKMKGRHLRVENTRGVPASCFDLFPSRCIRDVRLYYSQLYSGTPVGRSQFSRRYCRAIYRRISFWRPRVVIVVIVVAPALYFVMEEKYRCYVKRIYRLPAHVRVLTKGFVHCPRFLSHGSDSTRS